MLKVGKIIFVLNKNIKAFKNLFISKYVKKSKKKKSNQTHAIYTTLGIEYNMLDKVKSN